MHADDVLFMHTEFAKGGRVEAVVSTWLARMKQASVVGDAGGVVMGLSETLVDRVIESRACW